MAIQIINLGNFANDGTGDDLRTAFQKVNANFEEIKLQGGQANTISNVGTGLGLYKEKIGVDLKLRTLVSGTGVSLELVNSNEIKISGVVANAITTVNSNSGTINATSSTQAISIVGGHGITTSVTGNILTVIGTTLSLSEDPNPILAADLDLNSKNVLNGSTITSETFIGNLQGNVTGNVTGNLSGLVNGFDVNDIAAAISGFDFGSINLQFTNTMQFFLAMTNIDMGTITNPLPLGIEGGTII